LEGGNVYITDIKGIHLDDALVVSIVRLHLNDNPDGGWDENITFTCQWCGKRLAAREEVLQTIQRLARDSNLVLDDPDYIFKLPDEAWDDPGLLADCPSCGKPLKFNPFIVDNSNRPEMLPESDQAGNDRDDLGDFLFHDKDVTDYNEYDGLFDDFTFDDGEIMAEFKAKEQKAKDYLTEARVLLRYGLVDKAAKNLCLALDVPEYCKQNLLNEHGVEVKDMLQLVIDPYHHHRLAEHLRDYPDFLRALLKNESLEPETRENIRRRLDEIKKQR